MPHTLPIRFELNGAPVEVAVAPTTTLLRLLRDHLHLTGTKEGCAEGDCGACSIAWVDGGQWRAVDACLIFAPQAHGRRIRTVEGLRRGSTLHPVQQAFVDARASQCGYCTPGFVMAAFDACHRDVAPQDLDDAVAGNLCRCTGYRSIQQAVRSVAGTRPDDGMPAQASTPSDWTGERWFQPNDLGELLVLRAAHPTALLVAGATDIALRVTRKHETLPLVLCTEAVHELQGISETTEGWNVRAGTRLTDMMGIPHAALNTMLRVFGSRQIRSRATIGGNLATASPIGDLAPVLVASGATVTLVSVRGVRTVGIEAFFTGYRTHAAAPDEIILDVFLPRPGPQEHVAAYKISRRTDMDISAVALATWVHRVDEIAVDVRLAWGGVSARAGDRSIAVETAVRGKALTAATIENAVAAWDFSPLSDIRGSADYRMLVAGNLLRAWLRDVT